MKSCCDSEEVRATRVIKITVETSSAIAKEQKRKIAEIEIKGHFCPSHDVRDDVKMFAKVEYSTMMIIGGSDNRRFVEHFRVDQRPMAALLINDRSKIGFPEQMKYPPSYSTKMIIGGSNNPRFVEHFCVDLQPTDVLIIKDRSKIDVPEQMKYSWPKRDQKVIPALPGEEDTSDEEEYDEFEEEIVVMNVRREGIWKTWLERPKQETKTAGISVEDLIEIPSMQAKTQDSPSDEFLIEEKIIPMERPPVIHAELPDLSFLENM